MLVSLRAGRYQPRPNPVVDAGPRPWSGCGVRFRVVGRAVGGRSVKGRVYAALRGPWCGRRERVAESGGCWAPWGV